MNKGLKAGWARPGLSRKFHYFPAGELRSLCNRWLFAGDYREDEYDDHEDNCAACMRRVAKHRAMSNETNAPNVPATQGGEAQHD